MIDGCGGGLRTITPHSDPDLWWAMCGAGGFFGVVVEFCVRLFPIPARLADALAVVDLAAPSSEAVATTLQASMQALGSGSHQAIEYNTVLCGGGPDLAPCLVLAATSFAAQSTPAIEADLDAVRERLPAEPLVWRREEVPYLDVMRSIDPTYEFPGVCCYGGVLNFSPNALPHAVLTSLVDKYRQRTSPRSVVLLAPGYPAPSLECAVGFRGGFIVGVYALWQRSEGGAVVDGDASHIAWAEDVLSLVRGWREDVWVGASLLWFHS